MTVLRHKLTSKAATVEKALRMSVQGALGPEVSETMRSINSGFNAPHLVLPYPPSTNSLYRAVKGRSILSKAYRDWITQAGMEVMLQRPKRTLGKVGITISLKAPDKRRRDLDNVGGKAVLDLLVRHSLIEGDDSRFVRALHMEWVEEGHPCMVIIKPAVF